VLPGGFLAVAFHYFAVSPQKARVVILDLNRIAAESKSDEDGLENELHSSTESVSVEEADEGASEVMQRMLSSNASACDDSGKSTPDSSERRDSTPSKEEDDDDDNGGGGDEDDDDDDDDEEGCIDRISVDVEKEKGRGKTWRVLPGTFNRKVNAMAVLPDGRLVGGTSNNGIWVCSFSSKNIH